MTRALDGLGYSVPTSKKNRADMLPLRITVLGPPPGIMWALQLGRDELVKPTSTTRARISFDFAVEVVESDSGMRLRGPAVQGKPGGRFVYLCIGTYAGQLGTDVARRAKIGLEGIDRKLVKTARAKSVGLEVEFAGTDSKGGAACATVPLLAGGWRVA